MMKQFKKTLKTTFFLSLILCGAFLLHAQKVHSLDSSKVLSIKLDDDTINPVTADYITNAIDRAVEQNAVCLIIKLDTPGGLLTSTRQIVKKMLTSKVPIVVYIAPSGSRAGSAGVFITYASHVAAMAPSTNIGAAHPVQMGGTAPKKSRDWDELREMINDLKEAQEKKEGVVKEEKEEKKDKVQSKDESTPDEDPMSSKILQDTLAFIKAIAKERNRNVEWAVDSVAKSASITDEEALAKGVVEIIAKNDDDLLKQLDGRVVQINNVPVTLNTKEAVIETIEMDARQRFFNVLANPNIAYFLMILGFYGLLFEVTHPGFGVPGVLGIVFLILAFYSMQTLPTNYAGLALIIVGLSLLIAEAYVPGFGILTLGGLVCMILGSMLLFEAIDPVMRVSISAILSFSITTAAITFFLIRAVLRSQKFKVQGGEEGLIGEKGEARSAISSSKRGKVFTHGEIWNATSEDSIKKGDEIEVVKVEGLLLTVKKWFKEGVQ